MSTRAQETQRIKETTEAVENSDLPEILKRNALIILRHGPNKRQVTVIKEMLRRHAQDKD